MGPEPIFADIPEYVPRASPEKLEELRGLSTTELESVKKLALSDLWVFSKGICNYDQLYEPLHGPYCEFLVMWDGSRTLTLMPRGWLKSTINTVANPLRRALKDPVNYRGCIESDNLEKACLFLSQIKGQIVHNEALHLLFPELIPIKFGGPGSDWSAAHASLNTPRSSRESTWTCLAAESSGTGYHFCHIMPDDIIGEKHKQNRADMERVRVWNRSNEQLLDKPAQDVINWAGTRKLVDDVYATMIEDYGESLAVFHVEPFDENGESTFPTKMPTWWLLEKMKRDPEEWAHDYMNNPMGKGGIDWGKSAIRNYEWGKGRRIWFYATEKGLWRSWGLGDLDIVMTCDPNSGQRYAPDKAAIVVHGVSPDEDVFVLECKADRWSPGELVDELWNTAYHWKPRQVGIEIAGQQNTHYYFMRKCEEQNYYFGDPFELKPENKEKEIRVRQSLDPIIRDRRLFTHQSQIVLREQLEKHPQLAKHNRNEIDCLAYGPRMYRKGVVAEEQDRQRDLKKKILGFRGSTGYGVGRLRQV